MKINILLPYKEKFDNQKASSVSITVSNNMRYSNYLDDIRVFGQQTDDPIFKNNFFGFEYSLYSLKSKNNYLADQLSNTVIKTADHKQLVEIHNRPYLVRRISKKLKTFPISLFLHNDPKQMKGAKSISERKELLSNCAAIFCVSKYIRDQFLDGLNGNYKRKIFVLYNGVERKLVKFPKKNKEVLFVGRLVPEKGAHFYVDALKLIAEKYPKWVFGIIGSYRLGDNENANSYANQVIKKFKELGSQAQFYGFKDHRFVEQKMKKASIIVVPSLWQEPFGLVVAEAMSNGLCTIASKVGGIPEILEDNGILISNINYKKISKKINQVMRNNDLREHYQHKAWKNFKLSSDFSSKKLDNFRKIIFQNHF